MIRELINQHHDQLCYVGNGECLEMHVFGHQVGDTEYADVREFVREWRYGMEGQTKLPKDYRKRRWMGLVWGNEENLDPDGGVLLVALPDDFPQVPKWLEATI